MRPRGPTRRGLALGGLSAALAAACGARVRAAEGIAGRIVDGDHAAGHALRDGTLAGTPAREVRARVVVVGGGVAGLAAAWRLARAGARDVVTLELGAEAGGTSRAGTTHGLAHPWGAHYLPVPRADQRALAAFLVEAGLARPPAPGAARLGVDATNLVRAPDERLWTFGTWDEGLWPRASGPDEEQLSRFEAFLDDASVREPGGARPFDLPLARSGASRRDLDGRSAADLARELGLDGERMRWWLEYATRDDFGARLEDTSAWALVHYFTARRDAAGATGEYLTWPEGNARLVRALRALAPAVDARTRQLALRVAPVAGGATVDALDLTSGEVVRYRAERVVLATPQFITRRLLAADPAAAERAAFRYGPWVVANLHLDEPPRAGGGPAGAAPAWDNVRYGAESLGYVDATHQLDRTGRDAVWTWYLPVTEPDERAARARLLAAPWESWRDLVLADLRGPHPDLVERVTRIDVWRWGHAMVKPVPGFVWGAARARAATAVGPVHFAHTDLSGMALFEEAHWQGTRAAEEVLAALGIDSEPLA